MSSETEDSLARLVTRQADAMHNLREQRGRLLTLLMKAETGLRLRDQVHAECNEKLIAEIQGELKNVTHP